MLQLLIRLMNMNTRQFPTTMHVNTYIKIFLVHFKKSLAVAEEIFLW